MHIENIQTEKQNTHKVAQKSSAFSSKCQYQWFVYLLDLDLLCFLFFVAFLGAPLKFFSCKLEVKQLL